MRTFWTLNKLTAPWSVCHNLELVVLDSNLVRRKENQRPMFTCVQEFNDCCCHDYGLHKNRMWDAGIQTLGILLPIVSYSVFGDWSYQSGASDLSWRSLACFQRNNEFVCLPTI